MMKMKMMMMMMMMIKMMVALRESLAALATLVRALVWPKLLAMMINLHKRDAPAQPISSPISTPKAVILAPTLSPTALNANKQNTKVFTAKPAVLASIKLG